MINSGVLQLLSDLVASHQGQLITASDAERKDDYVLNERVILCSSQLLQLIAIRTGLVAMCVLSTIHIKDIHVENIWSKCQCVYL